MKIPKLPFYAIIQKKVIKINRLRKWRDRNQYLGNILGDNKIGFVLEEHDLKGKIPKNQQLMEVLYGK